MATSLVVDDIATDGDLAKELGSESKLNRLMPSRDDRDEIRVKSLQDVVNALLTRTPPVLETELYSAVELKDAVVYRALVRMCRSARSVAGDSFDVLGRDYDREYQSAVRRSFTLRANVSSPGGYSVQLVRR